MLALRDRRSDQFPNNQKGCMAEKNSRNTEKTREIVAGNDSAKRFKDMAQPEEPSDSSRMIVIGPLKMMAPDPIIGLIV